ncbi:M15 family metallopeptidase [Chitinolyticbacter albus]|uniref:M15 family metallopeptidase n=1 Tax=Chitinolyticbacter albus TaxID=2961951 RepID=UPI00210D4AA0|nr:M15 family metallopeptidase [Chitinolyticbacter albus]
MGLNREQAVFLQHVAELIRKAPELGLTLTGGELYRTPEQQALHIKNGRSKTMNSQHLKRLAIDLNFFETTPDGKLNLVQDSDAVRQLGAFWESLDTANRWGGNWQSFKDAPHFERREGTLADATSEAARPTATSTVVEIPAPPTRGLALLGDTVGFRARNLRDDVETVQRLVNLNVSRIGLTVPLQCDGIIGEKTMAALRTFRSKVLGVDEADLVLKPRDATLGALCLALPKALDNALCGLLYLHAADAVVTAFAGPIADTMTAYDINTPLRQAHFLSQIGHESGELRFREELASGAAYEGRRDLGNTQPGDGVRYKGRGLIQLTGRANYGDYARTNRFGTDVLANPALVASDDALTVDVAGWYWDKRRINMLADRDDVEAVTRAINGGLNGLSDRKRLLTRARTLLGA